MTMGVAIDDDLAWRVRRHVYAAIVTRGAPPAAGEVATALDLPLAATRAALLRLHELHAIFLEPDGESVRMAHPFSAIATGFRVRSRGVGYWANCAWDALGIPAALGQEAEIDATYTEDGQPARLDVVDDTVHGDGFVHFLLPLRLWYNDLIFT
jgi:hypothetical protein